MQKVSQNIWLLVLPLPFSFHYTGELHAILVGTGLAEVFSQAVLSISTAATFPMLTFLMEGFIHIFIPSSWIVICRNRTGIYTCSAGIRSRHSTYNNGYQLR